MMMESVLHVCLVIVPARNALTLTIAQLVSPTDTSPHPRPASA